MENNSPIEIWKNIPNFNGKYQVSNFGRVKSLHYGKERILISLNPKARYNVVKLQLKGWIWDYLVHILVAEAFIGSKPPNMETNHKDGNKRNNRWDNLEYVTHSENEYHAYELGLVVREHGENHHNSKLTDEKIKLIRSSPLSLSELSEKLSISKSVLSKIRRYEAWNHVE